MNLKLTFGLFLTFVLVILTNAPQSRAQDLQSLKDSDEIVINLNEIYTGSVSSTLGKPRFNIAVSVMGQDLRITENPLEYATVGFPVLKSKYNEAIPLDAHTRMGLNKEFHISVGKIRDILNEHYVNGAQGAVVQILFLKAHRTVYPYNSFWGSNELISVKNIPLEALSAGGQEFVMTGSNDYFQEADLAQMKGTIRILHNP